MINSFLPAVIVAILAASASFAQSGDAEIGRQIDQLKAAIVDPD